MRLAAAFALALVAAQAMAEEEDFTPEFGALENARLSHFLLRSFDAFDMPVAAFSREDKPVEKLEGAVREFVYVREDDTSTLEAIRNYQRSFDELGYGTVFECAGDDCGGFDFRFGTEVLPGPNMYVNLASFQYLTAVSGPADAPESAVGILVSSTEATSYVQIISAGSMQNAGAPTPTSERGETTQERRDATSSEGLRDSTPSESLPQTLLDRGSVILDDLRFASGTTDLGPGPFDSLKELAAFLEARAGFRLALVGHTDSVGALDSNIEVSRARAEAVRARLVESYDVPADRLDADGMGYLSPVASNQTADGRNRNRRVEAVLLPGL